jgi:hypothetical protein
VYSSSRSKLVEGVPAEEYDLTIKNLKSAGIWHGKSFNFLEMIKEDNKKLLNRITKIENLFVYNIDLFNADINPDEATRGMTIMRASAANNAAQRQLILARPSGFIL